MKRILSPYLARLSGAYLLTAYALLGAAAAQSPLTSQLPPGFIADGAIRARYEIADWFEAPGQDNSYTFPHFKTQLGVGYKTEDVKLYVQGQYNQLLDVPADAAGGIGSVYYNVNEQDNNAGEVYLRQFYVQLPNIGQSGLALQAGRFIYGSGNEVKNDDKTMDWLKSKRVGDRMIGGFDYTFGRSYDGARVDYAMPGNGTLTAAGFKPTQGGYDAGGMDEIEEITVGTLAWTIKTAPDTDIQVFDYIYGDNRSVVKPDNRAQDIRSADVDDITINTLGAHWIGTWKGEGSTVDAVLWGALQAGEWGEQDHFAGAVVAETGYRFDEVQGKPWVRAGYNYGSGDNDAGDDDHTTFFQMLPTARLYAQTPFFNMMNMHDLFVQLLWKPMEKLTWRSDFHYLTLVNDEDLFYSGAGAGEYNYRFGYSGLPSGGDSHVGELLDLQATYDFCPWASLTVYYGHVFGGNVLSSNFTEQDDIDYVYVELLTKL